MILIVEDHKENAELFQIFLERKGGFTTKICTDGDEILCLCERGQVKLVVLDIQLHKTFLDGKPVTGIDLAQRLKKNPKSQGIPILIASAHAMKDQREYFLKNSGAEAYFTKPVENYDMLIADIRKLLGQTRL